MINAEMYYSVLEVQIKGPPDEFEVDLERIKALFSKKDRFFDAGRRAWIIKNVENYRHIPFVNLAIKERKRQPTLF